MTRERCYLDHNATAPLRPAARAALAAVLDRVGNASSVHHEGRTARGAVDRAREAVGGLCGASPRDVIFTSGATEANAMALVPGVDWSARPGAELQSGFDRLLVLATEHPCVLEGHRFPADRTIVLGVDGNGVIDLPALDAALAETVAAGKRPLVAVQAANNETGVIQPVPEVALRVHAAGGLLHCDAVQVPGRLPVDEVTAGADMIALSAHKFGGPQGVGALVLRAGGIHIRERLLRGGGQELGMRAGSENVAGIAGFGAAASDLGDVGAEAERLRALRDEAEAGIRMIAPDAVLFGEGADRLPNTAAFAIPGLPAETAVMRFDLAGIALSSGSACSSGRVRRSHVLLAMGVPPDLAVCALRISFGSTSTRADVIRFLRELENSLGSRKDSLGVRAA
jgi:cysteine desulfurase